MSGERPALARPLAFPSTRPAGYEPLAREPLFDPRRHLALERPESVLSLADLGYGEEEIAACPSRLAITAPFRLLSEEGVACLQEVARALAPYATSNARIQRNVRGGAYRSRFLRDLCCSPEITEWIAALCGAPLAPHTLPHQLGHLNYAPKRLGENVDKWHVDTLRIDYVLFVTDPNALPGGEFEYFRGTRHELQALREAGLPFPPERIVAPPLPGAGYAVLQQGNMVVHRARGLRERGERITLVNGYVPLDLRFPDYLRYDQLVLADPAHVVTAEYERHVAWLAGERARLLIERSEFTDRRDLSAARLEAMAEELRRAAAEIRNAEQATMEHFGEG